MTRKLTKEQRDEPLNTKSVWWLKEHAKDLRHDLDTADREIEVLNARLDMHMGSCEDLRAKLAEAELANRHLQAMWDLEKKALENERESHQQTNRYCDQYRDKLAEAEADYARGADAFADELLALRAVERAARNVDHFGIRAVGDLTTALAAVDALRKKGK